MQWFKAILYLGLVAVAQGDYVSKAEASSGVMTAKSPHGKDGDCIICHSASGSELSSSDITHDRARELRLDFNSVCLQCHNVSFGHGMGKRLTLNKKELPLDNEGMVTCAITCHNMHVSNPGDPVQTRFHLRLAQDDLCTSCHNK